MTPDRTLTDGLRTGVHVATCRAYMDTPYEGFRLPAAGYAVAAIETHRAFLTVGRPPGKFAAQPAHRHHPALRSARVVGHGCLWEALALALIGTLTERPYWFTTASLDAAVSARPAALLGAVALIAATLAVLVISRLRHHPTGEPS